MPPAHLVYTTNLTIHHPVGAGHARPATLSLHPFYLKTVGEGFIPPAYPTPSLTKRFTCRGGIHAARAPCLYHQPNPCHPVGAGHARPAGLPLHPFHLNPVGEGFIPPAHPTPSLTKRFTCRGGIHAARAPCQYHQPNPPPPCRGRACPARNLPDTTTCGQCATNPQHASCPKILLEICRKNQKQPLTIVIHIAIIIKLSRGGHAAKSAS